MSQEPKLGPIPQQAPAPAPDSTLAKIIDTAGAAMAGAEAPPPMSIEEMTKSMDAIMRKDAYHHAKRWAIDGIAGGKFPELEPDHSVRFEKMARLPDDFKPGAIMGVKALGIGADIFPAKEGELLQIGTIVSIRPGTRYEGQSKEPGEIVRHMDNGWAYQVRFPNGKEPYYDNGDLMVHALRAPLPVPIPPAPAPAMPEAPKLKSEDGYLPVGSRVVLRSDSEYVGQSSTPGIITHLSKGSGHCYTIRWDSGGENVYKQSDVMLVDKKAAKEFDLFYKKTFKSLNLEPISGIKVMAFKLDEYAKGRTGVIESVEYEKSYVRWEGDEGTYAYRPESICYADKSEIKKIKAQTRLYEKTQKEKERLQKKATKETKVTVSTLVHNFMADRLLLSEKDTRGRLSQYPQIMVYGGDEKKRIVAAVLLPHHTAGCYAMVMLDQKHLTRAYIHLVKLGLKPFAIGRIGVSIKAQSDDHAYAGHGLGNLTKMGALLVTMRPGETYACVATDPDGSIGSSRHRKVLKYEIKKIKDSKIFIMEDSGLIKAINP